MMRKGFTLVELVVVVMILGILAAVAAPRLFNASSTATDNGARQSLAVIRDAIGVYTAENGGVLPPCTGTGANLRAALQPYMRGDFPKCPVGPAQNDQIAGVSSPATNGDPSPIVGWKYNKKDGTFIINFSGPTASDPGVNYDEL